MAGKTHSGSEQETNRGAMRKTGNAGGATSRGWMNPVGPDPELYPDPSPAPESPPASGTPPVASEPANVGSGTANVGSDSADVGSGTSKSPKGE